MSSPTPHPDAPWQPLTPRETALLLRGSRARWWLSGGVALDQWLGHPIRDRVNIDISTTPRDVDGILEQLPPSYTSYALVDGRLVPADRPGGDSDRQPILVYDSTRGAWVLQLNVEDGTAESWVYRRDPRLQVPWDRAVLEVDGIPTGAPEVQLVWKALRPRAVDTVDKDAVLPRLSAEAVAFYETALLRIHPHSTWAIHVRSPFSPARPSWNRSGFQAGPVR